MWRIDVTPRAREAIASLDPGLREELIERASDFAERPMELLRRSIPGQDPTDTLAFDYQSKIVAGLRVSLFLTDLRLDVKRMTLVAVGHVMTDEGDAPAP